ncbi:MAG: efflux RND transporter periplasmic adaptor subunit [Blastocatellia bacterium]|nr:efflux RND transporter periplasmic adaptor subunit [Blastocatellia bacterium]
MEVTKGRLLIVSAEESGILREIKVKDGDWVEQGTVLGVCQDLETEKQLLKMQADLEQKQLRIAGLQSQKMEQQAVVQQAESLYTQKHIEADELRAESAAIDAANGDSAETTPRYPPELLELRALVRSKRSDEQLQKLQKERYEYLLQQGLSSQLEVDFARNRSQIAEHERRAAEERFSAACIVHRRKLKAAITEESLASKGLEAAVQKLKTIDAELTLTQEQISSARNELAILEKKKDALMITAPRAGLIISPGIETKLGQLMIRGAELCRIADVSQIQVIAEVSEWDVSRINKGNNASLRVRSVTQDIFYGTVTHINTEAIQKPETGLRVYNCEILINNQRDFLRPGMSGVARISLGYYPGYLIFWHWLKRSVRPEYWVW